MKTNKVNIVHVISTIEKGGAENQLLVLAKLQVKRGHVVDVVYLKGKRTLEKDFIKSGIKVNKNLSNRKFIFQILIFRKYMFGKKNTIVHAHLPAAELLCRFSLKSNAKLIVSRHFGGQFSPKSNSAYSSFLGRLATRNVKTIIAISNTVKEVLIKNNEVFDDSKIKVVHYGFSTTDFLDSATEKISVRAGDNLSCNLGTVARLSAEKDLPTLLKAFKILLDKFPGLNLSITGEGPEETNLKQLSYELGISNHVIWNGKRENICDIMKNLDVFIFPSKFEGFGMVLLEAMAVEIPIVASRNSAIAEVIGDSGAGLLFETSNETELADAVASILTNRNNEYKIFQNERLNLFSAEKMENLIEKIYLRIQDIN